MIYTNEELNRMAAGVLGECWHEWDEDETCTQCGEKVSRERWRRIPDYCNDPNHAVRVAQAVDVETLGRAIEILEGHRCCNTPNWGDKVERYGWITDFATLPAKTLLLAAFVAHGIMPMDEAKENL